MEFSENGLPFGAIATAPAFTARAASGMSCVTTMAPCAARSAIQSSAASMPAATTTRSISGSRGTAIGLLLHDIDLEAMPLGDAIDFLLHRAGVGVDIDRRWRCLVAAVTVSDPRGPAPDLVRAPRTKSFAAILEVQVTFRFSAEVLPRLLTSSYSTR